jgi:hypothetical protein
MPVKDAKSESMRIMHDPARAQSLPVEGTSKLSPSLSESLVPLLSTTPSAIAGLLRKVELTSLAIMC